ncbi:MULTISPECIES: TetR/AcrR family transcriptional regulator [Sphingomonadaceae]|uniref:HTH tetR-type domain-containing protein n=1 Tax=Sphingomonas sanxanigenens DSM 19645 = NX02 TaxID=1123269 RepID=W0A759_9SPHN|nr:MULTISPECIES: TetR/AcrR family transcriptional regulator [Sphingomonadaceae]AHE52312.1 hypothetical protein NX02_02770 [Sphingomonas sanxanigenens DSM 19645 = NX02]
MAARLGEHILEVALRQFITEGAEGASMDRIAAAANVSKRTLYTRYGSKKALLVAATEHGTARHLKPIRSAIPHGTPREQVLHVARKLLDLSLSEELIGIQTLVDWIAKQGLETNRPRPSIGATAGVSVILPILRQAASNLDSRDDDLPFIAGFVFDALVGAPRTRILWRRDLANTAQAKADYLERTMDLVAQAVPLLAGK